MFKSKKADAALKNALEEARKQGYREGFEVACDNASEPCRNCHGKGRYMGAYDWKHCNWCKGSGWVSHATNRKRDWL